VACWRGNHEEKKTREISIKEGVVGILGGMGSGTTAGLFQKIITKTWAGREDHADIARLLKEAGAKLVLTPKVGSNEMLYKIMENTGVHERPAERG
jgi:hypothetical protein